MSDTTPNHALRYPEGTDDAVVAADLENLATDVDDALSTIAPAQIVGVDPGKILIADGAGVLTERTISGDATISNTGVLELGAEKVGTNELDDEAVTTAKLADEAVTREKTSGFIQTKRQAVTSLAGGSMTEITCVWDEAFPDTNYTAVVNVFHSGTVTLLGLGVIRITERTASQIKVLVANNAAGALSGTLFAIAIAD